MENKTSIKHKNGNDANRLLAAAIISAVLKSDWSYMLTLFPEGVEHRTYKYKEVSDFDDWETYEDFASIFIVLILREEKESINLFKTIIDLKRDSNEIIPRNI